MVKSKVRRTHRKGTRKATRKMRKMRGGVANVGDDFMLSASKMNMAQGQQYAASHANQHGGQSWTNMASSAFGMVTNGAQNNGGQNNAVANNGAANNAVMNNGNANNGNLNNQAGGMAPVGDTGVMDVGRTEARIGGLDASFNEIKGMQDGGRRRKKSKKTKRRKSKKNARKYMRGGTANVSDPTTLLPVGMERQAVSGMNPEWRLANNPSLV